MRAACGCATMAVASEIVQFVGLALVFFLVQWQTGYSPLQATSAFIDAIRSLGPVLGGATYVALLAALQTVPLAAGFYLV